MISTAVWVLTLAVAFGTVLALWHLRAADGLSRPPRAAGIAHAIVGAIGFGLLLLVLRGPPRGIDAGVGSFGMIAAILIGLALLTGIALFVSRRGAIVMAVHAGLAITGYVLLLAWNALG